VFCGNLPPDVKEKEVEDLFHKARTCTLCCRLAGVQPVAPSRTAGLGPAALPDWMPEKGCRCLGHFPLVVPALAVTGEPDRLCC